MGKLCSPEEVLSLAGGVGYMHPWLDFRGFWGFEGRV